MSSFYFILGLLKTVYQTSHLKKGEFNYSLYYFYNHDVIFSRKLAYFLILTVDHQ